MSISWPTAEIVGIGHAATRARDALVVERPEVFARAAAAADDHDVGACPTAHTLVERVA